MTFLSTWWRVGEIKRSCEDALSETLSQCGSIDELRAGNVGGSSGVGTTTAGSDSAENDDGTRTDNHDCVGDSHQANIAMIFVRNIYWHIDSFAATNKSQHCFGAIALLLACGVLDVIRILFMVSGHTKFGPDLFAASACCFFK